MTNELLHIITRVAKRRYESGEDLDVIFADYSKLTDSEKEIITAEIIPAPDDLMEMEDFEIEFDE